MSTTVTIEGLRELDAKLQKLDQAVRDDVAEQVLLEGADDMLVIAKSKVPVDTGALRDSLDTWAEHHGSVTSALVGTTAQRLRAAGQSFRDSLFSGDTFYAGFVELGYRRGKRRGGHRVGTKYVIENDTREQVPARPFLRPAFDEVLPRFLQALPSRLSAEIDRVVA